MSATKNPEIIAELLFIDIIILGSIDELGTLHRFILKQLI
jgi:hypothetical protein